MSRRVDRAAELGLSLQSILQRVAEEAGASNDSELCRALQVGRSSLPSWRERDSVPFEPLFTFARERHLSMDWLLEGRMPKHLASSEIADQELMIRDAVLGDETARRYRERKGRAAAAADRAELDLERMQDCIQVLAELVEQRGQLIKPDKFARACIILYELHKQTGSLPASYSLTRLIETIA